MADLTRNQVKDIVLEALRSVAGLPADPEASTFDQMQDAHKQTFLNNLKAGINGAPYHTAAGTVSTDAYYDVDLTMDSFDNWQTAGACIGWVTANQMTVIK